LEDWRQDGVVFFLIWLLLLSKDGIAAESIRDNIIDSGFVMKLRSKFLNDHTPIEDSLGLDIAIDQVLMVRMNTDVGAPE
jgi:hypothetical protein